MKPVHRAASHPTSCHCGDRDVPGCCPVSSGAEVSASDPDSLWASVLAGAGRWPWHGLWSVSMTAAPEQFWEVRGVKVPDGLHLCAWAGGVLRARPFAVRSHIFTCCLGSQRSRSDVDGA